MSERAEEARRNRERMPETAALVDAWKRRFPGARFPYVREGELEVGTPAPKDRAMNVDQWLRYVKTGELPTWP